jgi:hypothetical protein
MTCDLIGKLCLFPDQSEIPCQSGFSESWNSLLFSELCQKISDFLVIWHKECNALGKSNILFGSEKRRCVMKVTFNSSSDYRDFLAAEFDDVAGSGFNRENRFREGVRALSDIENDIDLDLDQDWLAGDELSEYGLIRH